MSTGPKQGTEAGSKHGQPGSQHHGKNMYLRSKKRDNWMRATVGSDLTPLDFSNDWPLLYTRRFRVHPSPTCSNKMTCRTTSHLQQQQSGLHCLQCKCLPICATLYQVLKKSIMQPQIFWVKSEEIMTKVNVNEASLLQHIENGCKQDHLNYLGDLPSTFEKATAFLTIIL